MAYRYEKNENGEADLIIDGFEDGIADSPYLGIANMRNLNTSWYPGVAYSNYKRIRVNSVGGNTTFTADSGMNFLTVDTALTLQNGDAVTLTTTGTLPDPLQPDTTYFVVQNGGGGDGTFRLSETLGGSDITLNDDGTGVHTVTLITMGAPSFYTQNNSDGSDPYGTIYILDKNGRVWQNTATVNSLPYFVLLDGNEITGSVAQGIAFYANYLFVFRGDSIDVCGDGTGAINSGLWLNEWFFDHSVQFTAAANQGDTSGTLLFGWDGPSGAYNLTFTNESVQAALVTGSTMVTWVEPLLFNETDMANVNLGNSGVTRMAFVDVGSDTLYFCNGRRVGAISTPPGRKFDPQIISPGTSFLNYQAVALPEGIFSSWLEKQQLQLLIAAQDTIYPWDRISEETGIPMPITENIVKMINVSNTVYVLAGLKGNIYITNGYSISVARKLPDSIVSDLIDPKYTFGGPIPHRQKIYFPILAQNGYTGTNIFNGILSIDDKNKINFENQNSNGLTNAAATGDALTVDVNTSDYDSYYSAWYDGTTGGIDYNSTTLYDAGEPIIETDLIPIGTFAQSHTYLSMEFKLDQPMKSGDSITIYARNSLSDTYQLVGTTTTSMLSDFYQPLPFEKWQWIQFKVVISCNTDPTLSSFVRLREIRIR